MRRRRRRRSSRRRKRQTCKQKELRHGQDTSKYIHTWTGHIKAYIEEGDEG
jgi:hypothetical protein